MAGRIVNFENGNLGWLPLWSQWDLEEREWGLGTRALPTQQQWKANKECACSLLNIHRAAMSRSWWGVWPAEEFYYPVYPAPYAWKIRCVGGSGQRKHACCREDFGVGTVCPRMWDWGFCSWQLTFISWLIGTVCVCTYIYMCTFICAFVCICMWECISMHACACLYNYAWVFFGGWHAQSPFQRFLAERDF